MTQQIQAGVPGETQVADNKLHVMLLQHQRGFACITNSQHLVAGIRQLFGEQLAQ